MSDSAPIPTPPELVQIIFDIDNGPVDIMSTYHAGSRSPEALQWLCEAQCQRAIDNNTGLQQLCVAPPLWGSSRISGFTEAVTFISTHGLFVTHQDQLLIDYVTPELGATIVAMPEKAMEIRQQLGPDTHLYISANTLHSFPSDFEGFFQKWQEKLPGCSPRSREAAHFVWGHCKVDNQSRCNKCQGCPDIICPTPSKGLATG